MDSQCRLVYGPRENSVLNLQDDHRSEDVYAGQVDNILRWRHCGTPFWTLNAVHGDDVQGLHLRVVSLLHQMGFYGVYRSGWCDVDRHLLTALVERWRSETHTFHLRVGEATVTLQDISMIWGLPINGDPITGIDQTPTQTEWQGICDNMLGFVPPSDALFGCRIKFTVLRDWLWANPVTDDTSQIAVEQYTRGIALILLGSTMCPDSSGNLISLLYLSFMQDFAACGTFSWGSAVLAVLYRELCGAVRRNRSVIGGPMNLLQVWAWSRITSLVPRTIRDRINMLPLVQPDGEDLPPPPYGVRWAHHHSFTQTTSHSVRVIRDVLDRMSAWQFIWEPYELTDDQLASLPPRAKTRAWRSRSPLIHYAVIEYHYPDRVMRQFGMVQHQPQPIPAEHRALHGVDRRGYNNEDWANKHRSFLNEWFNRECNLVATVHVGEGEHSTSPDYYEWYDRITRRLIAPMQLPIEQGYQPSQTIAQELLETNLTRLQLSLDAEEPYEDIQRICRQVIEDARPLFTSEQATGQRRAQHGHPPAEEGSNPNASRRRRRRRKDSHTSS